MDSVPLQLLVLVVFVIVDGGAACCCCSSGELVPLAAAGRDAKVVGSAAARDVLTDGAPADLAVGELAAGRVDGPAEQLDLRVQSVSQPVLFFS